MDRREVAARALVFMTLWTELTSGLLPANFENVVSACCVQGKEWAAATNNCSGIPVTTSSYSQTCAVAQEKCCMETLERASCSRGVETARSMAPCEVTSVDSPSSAQCASHTRKTCCDCCALGLKARGLSLSCDMELLGQPCSRAYSECCRKGRMTSSSQAADVTASETSSQQQNAYDRGNGNPEGQLCESSANKCEHSCTEVWGEVSCGCRRGWRLADDGFSCEDVNECVVGTHTCEPGEFCFNNAGSFTCQRRLSCGTGYELTSANTCRDIDECALKIDGCRDNTECLNIRGSFRCVPRQCGSGFVTDAAGKCIDINECFSGDFSCPPRATCHNTPGAYVCMCQVGLRLSDDGRRCEDVNECEEVTARCRDGASCENTEGSYRCVDPPPRPCRAGYQPSVDGADCVDTDECAEATHTCGQGSTCINEEGGFRCQDPIRCPEGMRPSPNQQSCIDVDECENVTCGEGGSCVNLLGSYRCDCARGYKPLVTSSDDGAPAICEDVDECAESRHRCMYRCENTPGSFTCVCPPGYTLSSTGRACQDVDECAQGNDDCDASETCFNTRGSFKCANLTCPHNYTPLPKRRGSSVMKCWDRSNRVCIGERCPPRIKLYTYLHVDLPQISALHQPQLILRLRKDPRADSFSTSIVSGNEGGNFIMTTGADIAGLSLRTAVLGPWSTVLAIRASETYRSGQVKVKMVYVYVFVASYEF